MPSGATDCKVHVNTKLPLSVPYRTGSYLIYDYLPDQPPKPGAEIVVPRTDCPPPLPTHFREGTAIGLRASGSRQVDADPYADILKNIASKVQRRGKLCVVDLRQESHLFFDGLAVSWYADKDWSNMGQSLDWIARDEACRIDMSRGEKVQIFCITQDKSDGSVMPAGYSDVPVKSAISEEEFVIQAGAKLNCEVMYERIPVTDHCAPTLDAGKAFVDFCRNVNAEESWVHFHCHGGDGRTTTFLCAYDMFCYAKSGQQPFPTVEAFARRQMKLFCYDLDAANSPCNEDSDWKCRLAKVRWGWLGAWHDWLARGGAKGGVEFE